MSAGELVDEDPFLHGWDVGDDGHTGTVGVCVVGHVVHHGTPGLEVGGLLVRELLTVLGVALIRVEDTDGAIVGSGFRVRIDTR